MPIDDAVSRGLKPYDAENSEKRLTELREVADQSVGNWLSGRVPPTSARIGRSIVHWAPLDASIFESALRPLLGAYRGKRQRGSSESAHFRRSAVSVRFPSLQTVQNPRLCLESHFRTP